MKRTLHYLGKTEFDFGITLSSELPIGKGMASSSADIAAVCFAVAAAYGVELTAPEVSRIAAGIEPTDGVFFENIIRINHMTGECLETMNDFPALKIAVFDAGGAVDTVTFHQRTDLDELSIKNEQRTDAAMELVRGSCAPDAWAKAATESALANQSILPKKDLPELIEAAKGRGALGVNVAHSGTVIGVLFAPDTTREHIDEIANRLAAQFSHLHYCETVTLTSGGRIMEKFD
ncbi:MAG: GHMP kinase [Selenomonadaceae bacterium]|nr:GHMP kinase [Selenomonadaceae bacterium]